jgi:hypothetical protein
MQPFKFEVKFSKMETQEFMLCQLIYCLTANEEKLIKAKRDFIDGNNDCSPVMLF